MAYFRKIKKFDEPKNLFVAPFFTKSLYAQWRKTEISCRKQLRRYIFCWPGVVRIVHKDREEFEGKINVVINGFESLGR